MNSASQNGVDIKYKLIYYHDCLTIKGDYTVLSYDDNIIILKCANDSVCISGENIVISMLSSHEMYICGKILNIVFN
ncbi:MAG: YabP/YqfC family sporulation protein [Clostridia bacterium]|nr:YabP/YqfC family sporulation protein [Clostridia bacterium]